MLAASLERRRYTVDEIVALQDTGVISEEDNFELIEGEIVPMGPKYHAHELIKSKLLMALSRACPRGLLVGVETSIRLSLDTYVEPDISLFPKELGWPNLRGSDVLLAIEVAASSLAYDLGLKAKLYARYGVQEYWVVDANARVTFMHTGPSETGWASIVRKEPGEALAFAGAPGFSIILAEV